MKLNMFDIAFAFIFLIDCVSTLEQNAGPVNETLHFEGPSKILSRRKRYLIFPDGSSFQLVFCTQNHGYLQVHNVVFFGTTAALAWPLPTDPTSFHFLKEHAKDVAQRRDGAQTFIYFINENGKVFSKSPYKRKQIVNPAFARRSLDFISGAHINHQIINSMHRKQIKIKNLRYYYDQSSIDFHREGRRSFYVRLEKFMNAAGWEGGECVLRMLCEVGKGGTEQGTFLEEIIGALFTLPSERFEAELYERYDLAHRATGDCDKLYPSCEFNSIKLQSWTK